MSERDRERDRDRKRRTDAEIGSSNPKRPRSDRHHTSASSRSHHSSSSHRPSSSSAAAAAAASRSRAPVDVAKASKAFIPDAGAAGSQKKPKSEFLCEIVYSNTLPEVPFEPKLLKVYLPPERLTRYCGASLENSLKLPFLTDKMLGIPLDLIHTGQYNRPEYVQKNQLDPADESILPASKEQLMAGQRAQPTQRQLFEQGSSNWLRKQEFQSNNLYDMAIRTTGSAEQVQREFVRVEEAKKILAEENSKEKQVALIESTFEQARLQPKHPDKSKAHLRAVEILDIFPDFGVEGDAYAQAANVEVYDGMIGPDGEPLTEEELQDLRKKAQFNIEYAWTEFDHAPLEEKLSTQGSSTTTAAPMQVDDFAGSPSPPVASLSSTATTAQSQSNLIPLLKSYTKKYHGFYTYDPAHPKERNDESDLDEEEEQKEKALQADTNILQREFYRWQKEYVKVPTPLVNKENNYFFILKKREDGTAQGGTIHYAQYTERLKVAKRGQIKFDKTAAHDVRSRPTGVHVHYVKEYHDETAEAEEAEAEAEGGEDEEEGEDEAEGEAEESQEKDGDGDEQMKDAEDGKDTKTTDGGEDETEEKGEEDAEGTSASAKATKKDPDAMDEGEGEGEEEGGEAEEEAEEGEEGSADEAERKRRKKEKKEAKKAKKEAKKAKKKSKDDSE